MNQYLERLEFRANQSPAAFGIDLWGIHRKLDNGHEQRSVLKPVELSEIEHKRGEVLSPFITLQREEAQNLMDALWQAGIRPAEGQGSVGQLGAVQAHLQDMRRLVFERAQDKKGDTF